MFTIDGPVKGLFRALREQNGSIPNHDTTCLPLRLMLNHLIEKYPYSQIFNENEGLVANTYIPYDPRTGNRNGCYRSQI